MDPDDLLSELLLLVALILVSGFFVAAEFAVLSLRRRRVEQIARDDPARGATASSVIERAEQISLVTQLGSLASLLLLGYLATRLAIERLPALQPPLAMGVGIGTVALLYLILGLQLPRLLGAQRSAWVTSPLLVVILRGLAFVLTPITFLLIPLLEGLARLLKLSRSALHAPVHTLEDIRDLVVQGHEQGVVEEDEREMIRGVFDFAETVAREVMTPRIDMVAVPGDIGLEELIEVVVSAGHSRIPVFEGTIDNIVGVVLVKDLLPLMVDPEWLLREPFDVRRLMRQPFFVPDTKPVDEVLAEFRRSSVHLAVVIDEFGGTYGLVTMEDLLEEIVGEIKDEYDVEEPEFSATPEGDVLIDGGVSISEVNERYDLDLPEEDFDTIGGYIFGALGRIPVIGDRVEGLGRDGQDYLEVDETEERRVMRVRLRRAAGGVAPDSRG